ncbi:NADP-dependent oxidoreductase [Streptomyces sp. 8K308]|uniref:NADP-dependent oxidoreductase n=1 Tax=Streptomyces sp. 8K308 TaxID=2530388 RepID=UPI001045055D|nr:NADP-dependent oxidoreductase [Streptomyces sp. 8K308]TDC26651.1 NADP-dependent oxidoreductase [Streptomyces sp. 8K308]
MRALTMYEIPGTPVVAELPDPSPAAGELLVRVAAASLNGYDAALAGGMIPHPDPDFPFVLGKDFAGTVVAVGERVGRFSVGEAVFGVVTGAYPGTGSLAEYVTVAEAFGVSRIPAGVTPTDAGALGLAGTAALDAIEAIGPAPGDVVLISGATGGVGAFALQYALDAGAEVIATARPGPPADFVRGLSGDRVRIVDHAGDLLAQVRAIAPQGVSAALHFAGNGMELAELVMAGGRMASTLGFGPEQAAGRGFGVTAVTASPGIATLNRLAADVASGLIRVPITHTYSLAEVPQALTDFNHGALGKLAVALP